MAGKALTVLAVVVILGAAIGVYLIKQVPTVPESDTHNTATTTEDAWLLSPVSTQGTQFEYPEKLPTTFITAQEWPPQVVLEGGEYSCAEEQERIIGGREYCVVETSEGAAGSVYHTYEYITPQGDFIAHVKFTLKFPQCENYDEPQQNTCKAEQASFDIDGLADRIAQSIRMQ